MSGELGRGRRLAGALQAGEEDDGGYPGLSERYVGLPQGLDQFLVDDLDDLLAGGETAADFVTDGPLSNAIEEVTGDNKVDIGLQQRQAHLA